MLGARVGVRPGVDEHRGPEPRRHDDGDRRAHDAGQAPDVQQPRGEHRAGVPGGDDRVGLAGADRTTGGDEARVRLRAHGVGRLLVHLDHVPGDDALEPLRLEALRPVEDDVDPVARRLERARDDLGRSPVSPEGVDRYPRHYGA